ncbi:hypothetical protein [Streptococcus chenjunshii]|uniref:Uncharacterized protein n=1 Tax=Streptococcus chenjunshii TaxID=2173853 RepID=A0A372KPD7_9STRE|nr:hypothetical protein [Streptococcus chenjunshii]RFU53458.1 hypothetical protein DDV23_04485 [Streptococcus chenjunshii]
MKNIILAHYDRESGEKQSLEEHSFNVAQKAKKEAQVSGLKPIRFNQKLSTLSSHPSRVRGLKLMRLNLV